MAIPYQQLDVWRKGMDLVAAVYALTASYPVHERYGIVAQLRRAAVSVPCNIAEGNGRWGRKEYHHHVSIACGSAREVQTLLLIAERLGYGDRRMAQECELLTGHVAAMLARLGARLAERP